MAIEKLVDVLPDLVDPQSEVLSEDAAVLEFSTIASGTRHEDAPLLSISVVVPAKNEGKNVAWVLRGIPRWVHEVVLVDGDSTDGTVESARGAWPDIVVVQQTRPGKGAALRDGFAAATGDIVVMIDADGSMDPAEIEVFIEPLLNGECDLVKGSRWLDGGGSSDITPLRRAGNKMLLATVNRIFRAEFTELCYGFMAFRRPCIDCLRLTADGFEIETQIVVHAVRAGLRIQEVPSMEFPRRHGRSNLRPVRDGLRVLGTVAGALRSGPVPDPAGSREHAAVGADGVDAGPELRTLHSAK